MRLKTSAGVPVSLDSTLYDPLADWTPLDTFSACLNARGVYESQRFALRLSPVVHTLVNSAVAKSERGETSFTADELQAYSTYLHETVHWWQHKGSTSGFIRSVLYPIQTHSNMSELRQILTALGPQKPIQAVALRGELGLLPVDSAEVSASANAVTNNFMDTEFYLALTLKPTLDVDIYHDPYFEAAGHSFLIAYALVLGALRELIDSNGHLLPDPATLANNLTVLAKQRVRGYYYGSEIIRAPVGLLDIYEGQARFLQLQFLSFASAGLTIPEVRNQGMLDGVYGNAFRAFLKISDSPEPDRLDDPLIALFLVICDMSINPTAGFPASIENYEAFFLDADPGIRFATLCKSIANDAPALRHFVVNYSAEEYRKVVQTLSESTGLSNHLSDLSQLERHCKAHPEASRLIDEHRSFSFSPHNIALRILTGEFLAFVRDRLEYPEFFCWTGYWLTKEGVDLQRALWLKHLSLFTDKVDDGALFARLPPGRSAQNVLEAFNQFYASILLYDLTKQWVLNQGPFRLEYSWLTSSSTDAGFIERVKGVFRKYYGVDLDQFILVNQPTVPNR
jgi:hypothetical protein